MRPVHWSLKNQWTAHAVPVADILCGVGISVCLPATACAVVGMFLAWIQLSAAMAGFRGIGRWNLFYRDTSPLRLVDNELLQLIERPIVPILPCIRFRRAALLCALPDIRQIFQTDASVQTLRQR